MLPFAATAAQREAAKDPRPSFAERYRDKADYLVRVREAALGLQARGYLLAEDVDRIAARADAAFSATTKSGQRPNLRPGAVRRPACPRGPGGT